MNSSATQPGGIYCLSCYYNLRGLSENRCPECGRSFDPERPATFSRLPYATPVRDLAQRIGKAVEQALAPDDPQQILFRMRAGSAAQAAEIERLRRSNAQLRAHLEFVLDVLVKNGLATADDVTRLREATERATAHPVELIADEASADGTGEEEPITPDLLDLQRAAQEHRPRGD